MDIVLSQFLFLEFGPIYTRLAYLKDSEVSKDIFKRYLKTYFFARY